jgi:Cu-Zn family superoxide dismutase
MKNPLAQWDQVATDHPGMRISIASKASRRDTMKHPIATALTLALFLTAVALPVWAADMTVIMRKATQEGNGDPIGTITISASATGALFQLDLHGLPPGTHGFHIHENDSCGPTMMNGIRIPAGAAGNHFDPDSTGKHAGPLGEGHLGDLPLIDVPSNGIVKQTVTSPRVTAVEILRKRALIIHLNGDNYADLPLVLGGGGGRFACGVIQ